MKNKPYLLLMNIVLTIILVGCSSVTHSEPPKATVMITGEQIEMRRGTYQWESKGIWSNQTVIADAASPAQTAETMLAKKIKPHSIGNITFHDGSKPQIAAYLWEQEDRGGELLVKQNQITLPKVEGKHIIEIHAKWTNGDASYTFVIEI